MTGTSRMKLLTHIERCSLQQRNTLRKEQMERVENFRTKMFQLMFLLFTNYIQDTSTQDDMFLPSFKWNEGYKFTENKVGDRYSTHEEYIFKQLSDSGICRDKMGLDASVKTNDYLGMDLFMPFMGRYYDEDNKDMTSMDLTILTIHHLNTMVSYTYKSNRSPRPIFMGTFVKTPVETGSGEKKNMTIDPVTKQLDAICPRDTEKTYSDFITGYSMDGGEGNRKMVLVCEDKIARLNFIEDISKEGNWRRNPDEQRSQICPVEGQANRDENRQPKPIYCDRDGKKLMSIMALPKKQNDPKPYLIGYYSEDGGREKFATSREYIITVYESEDKEIKEGLTGAFKIDGHLAEIDVYLATAEGVEGMYFTIDGDACHFFKSYDELFEGGKLTQIPDFENPAERKFKKRNCQSYLTYIGCPMGFCYENNFDASFTIQEKDNGIDKTFIYFTKTMMYWKLEDTGLPLDIPRVKDAMKPVRKGQRPPSNFWEWLERGFDNVLNWLLKNIFGVFYSNRPCRDYLINKGSAVCMTRSVGAAFAVPFKGSYKIFLHETVKHNWFISMAGKTSESITMATDPFSKIEGTPYDAAWYNSKEGAVYLFSGNQYKPYTHDKDLTMWEPGTGGTLKDFGIDKEYLDAVVNAHDGNGYFFHDNFFWSVSEENWRRTEVVPGNLSLLDFFDVRGECFPNSEEDFEHLISRYKEKNWTLAEGNKHAIEENRRSTSKEPKPRSRLFILWFVLGGFLIVIMAYSAMYLYGKRDDKFVTKRKVEYIGSRTGRKTSPSKTSSRTSKKSNLSSIKTLSTPSSKVESKM